MNNYTHKFNNLDGMALFLERHSLQELIQQETDNLNSPISMKETEWTISNLPGTLLHCWSECKLAAALFTIAKTWKQTKFPSTDEWIKKIWYIYNGILLSHNKEWNNAICSNMDGPRDSHTKWSKPDRERQISYITYM